MTQHSTHGATTDLNPNQHPPATENRRLLYRFDKRLRLLSASLQLLLALLCLCFAARAQSLEAKITIASSAPGRARIEGKKAESTRVWSFRNAYASAMGLDERIEKLALFDTDGAPVEVRKIGAGEYEAARPAAQFRYELTLEPRAASSEVAHVSWLTNERALLLPGDMLPLPLRDAKLNFTLPSGWSLLSIENKNADGSYAIEEGEQSVFFAGAELRQKRTRAGSMELLLASAGEWAFSDEDAATSASDILKEHEKTFDGMPLKRAMLLVSPFPRPVAANIWSAETRGATVVLFTGRAPSQVAALAQLNHSLTHELFHLWVPNALPLDGDYDWFYEGFTLYQALRAGMRAGHLTFQDYLNALGRAFDGYKAAKGAKELSLLEASQRRWTVGSAYVYHKGMLVAFLYDLTLMRAGGKNSLDDVYRELFRRHRSAEKRENGNRAVLDVLASMNGMRSFTERYIQNPTEINLASEIEPFGLRVEPVGVRTHVGVSESLDRPRRELLRKLGYNEKADAETRRLHQQMKKRLP